MIDTYARLGPLSSTFRCRNIVFYYHGRLERWKQDPILFKGGLYGADLGPDDPKWLVEVRDAATHGLWNWHQGQFLMACIQMLESQGSEHTLQAAKDISEYALEQFQEAERVAKKWFRGDDLRIASALIRAGREFFEVVIQILSQEHEVQPTALKAQPTSSRREFLRQVNQAKALMTCYEDAVDDELSKGGGAARVPLPDILEGETPPKWFVDVRSAAGNSIGAGSPFFFLLTCQGLSYEQGDEPVYIVSEHCAHLLEEIGKLKKLVQRRQPSARRERLLELIEADLIFFKTIGQELARIRRALGLAS